MCNKKQKFTNKSNETTVNMGAILYNQYFTTSVQVIASILNYREQDSKLKILLTFHYFNTTLFYNTHANSICNSIIDR